MNELTDKLDHGVIEEIRAERIRQIEKEVWTPEHDDEHTEGELAQAAMAYAQASFAPPDEPYEDYAFWWPPGWDRMKRKTPRQDLVRAAALLVAEIERIDRASK